METANLSQNNIVGQQGYVSISNSARVVQTVQREYAVLQEYVVQTHHLKVVVQQVLYAGHRGVLPLAVLGLEAVLLLNFVSHHKKKASRTPCAQTGAVALVQHPSLVMFVHFKKE